MGENSQVNVNVMSKEEIGLKSDYWTLERSVSTGFNRLKGKLYNLIEATITDKQQCEAIKGLIKGFSNDEYALTLENMRYDARGAKFIPEDVGQTIPPLTAEPLENN